MHRWFPTVGVCTLSLPFGWRLDNEGSDRVRHDECVRGCGLRAVRRPGLVAGVWADGPDGRGDGVRLGAGAAGGLWRAAPGRELVFHNVRVRRSLLAGG